MFIVFAGLIVVIRLANREVILILPDDRAVVAAERIDRENNAYYPLHNAQLSLPSRPEAIRVSDGHDPDHMAPYMPETYTTTWALGIGIPPDHPEMLQFIEDSRPALDSARAALNRPYLRFPIPVAHWILRTHLPSNSSPAFLFSVWFAYGDAQIRYWNNTDAGVQSLADLWTVISMFDREPMHIYRRWQMPSTKITYFKMLLRLIYETEDPATLDALDSMVREHEPMIDDLYLIFESHMRAIDDTYLAPELMRNMGMNAHLDWEDKIELFQLQQVSAFYIEQLPHFQQEGVLMPGPFEQWMQQTRWYSVPWSDYMDAHVTLNLYQEMRQAWAVMQLQRATRIGIALQRFYLDHGAFPGELRELVPDYLSELPVNPITQQPFKYESIVENRQAMGYMLENQLSQHYDYDGRSRAGGNEALLNTSEFD